MKFAQKDSLGVGVITTFQWQNTSRTPVNMLKFKNNSFCPQSCPLTKRYLTDTVLGSGRDKT
jgi:hypothetical protein